MKDRKLATRYARALLASLPDHGAAAEADEFLTAIRTAMEESAEFRDLMLNPAIPRHARRSLLRELALQGGMPSQVGNFLATIVDHNRTSSLPSIAETFHEEREREAGIVAAHVTTAWPMADDLKQRTLRTLEQVTGRKVRLTTTVEPELLGGAVTRMGSTIHDGSLRTQLEHLRRRLIEE